MERDWRIVIWNELLELCFMTGSSMGLSNAQGARLKELYGAITDKGRDNIDKWARENDRDLSRYFA